MTEGFPKRMTHPHHMPAVNTVSVSGDVSMPGAAKPQQGRPERFPPVTVETPAQEAYYLSRGYLTAGMATELAGFSEFPKMLVHPQYVPAIAETKDARLGANGQVETFVISGTPEKFPPVTVNNTAEQERWEAKGWKAAAPPDPEAYTRAYAAPFDPSWEFKKYPMLVDGVLVQDPTLPTGRQEYPKWLGDAANGGPVGNLYEEQEMRQRLGMPPLEAQEPEEDDGPIPVGPAVFVRDAALDSLLARATKLGVDVQEGWSADQIMDAILAQMATPSAPPKNKGGRPRKNPAPLSSD